MCPATMAIKQLAWRGLPLPPSYKVWENWKCICATLAKVHTDAAETNLVQYTQYTWCSEQWQEYPLQVAEINQCSHQMPRG